MASLFELSFQFMDVHVIYVIVCPGQCRVGQAGQDYAIDAGHRMSPILGMELSILSPETTPETKEVLIQ